MLNNGVPKIEENSCRFRLQPEGTPVIAVSGEGAPNEMLAYLMETSGGTESADPGRH